MGKGPYSVLNHKDGGTVRCSFCGKPHPVSICPFTWRGQAAVRLDSKIINQLKKGAVGYGR